SATTCAVNSRRNTGCGGTVRVPLGALVRTTHSFLHVRTCARNSFEGFAVHPAAPLRPPHGRTGSSRAALPARTRGGPRGQGQIRETVRPERPDRRGHRRD